MGKIILLNTPIGNLGDLTVRVRESLENGLTFAVEDTRVFKELLNHLGISVSGKKILSLHDQSENVQIDKLVELAERENLYVASEAGSPIVSDPAFPLIVAAYNKGIKVESCSGVSAPVMALELSGLPPIPFQFHGFLPRESNKRKKSFSEAGYGTHIFFEAPTRIEDSVLDLASVRPDCQVAVVRELSKKFEEVLRFKASEWNEIRKNVTFKGEFVLLFYNNEVGVQTSGELSEIAQEMLANGATPKQLSKLLSLILDRPTKEIYSILSSLKKS